jgi:Fe-S-cluster-containing hydrogenase component 2
MPVNIDTSKCCLSSEDCECGCCNEDTRCCIDACPVEAIHKKDAITIDTDKCIDCGICVTVCPKDAIRIE